MLSQIYSFWYVENEVSTPMASVMEKLLSVKTIQDTVRLICQYKLLQNSGAIMLNRDGKFLSVREWLVMYKTFFSGFVMDRADKVDPGGTISGSLDRSTWQPWLRHWDVNVPPPQGDISFLAFKLPQDLFLRENKPEKKNNNSRTVKSNEIKIMYDFVSCLPRVAAVVVDIKWSNRRKKVLVFLESGSSLMLLSWLIEEIE